MISMEFLELLYALKNFFGRLADRNGIKMRCTTSHVNAEVFI